MIEKERGIVLHFCKPKSLSLSLSLFSLFGGIALVTQWGQGERVQDSCDPLGYLLVQPWPVVTVDKYGQPPRLRSVIIEGSDFSGAGGWVTALDKSWKPTEVISEGRVSQELREQVLGPRSHDPEIMTWAEIKSRMLNWVSHPGAPRICVFVCFFKSNSKS